MSDDDRREETERGRERPRLADVRDVDEVYRPAEDSYLLAETALERVEPDSLVLDVGTGSGYVGWRLREEAGAQVVGVDVNPAATARARERGLDVVQGDLVSPFRRRTFDVVCFNPPYLPAPPGGGWDDPMEAALTGGETGREVIERFLADAGRLLVPGGELLLLVSTLTGPDAVRETAAGHGFVSEVLAEEPHPFEKLLVFRLAVD